MIVVQMLMKNNNLIKQIHLNRYDSTLLFISYEKKAANFYVFFGCFIMSF